MLHHDGSLPPDMYPIGLTWPFALLCFSNMDPLVPCDLYAADWHSSALWHSGSRTVDADAQSVKRQFAVTGLRRSWGS